MTRIIFPLSAACLLLLFSGTANMFGQSAIDGVQNQPTRLIVGSYQSFATATEDWYGHYPGLNLVIWGFADLTVDNWWVDQVGGSYEKIYDAVSNDQYNGTDQTSFDWGEIDWSPSTQLNYYSDGNNGWWLEHGSSSVRKEFCNIRDIRDAFSHDFRWQGADGVWHGELYEYSVNFSRTAQTRMELLTQGSGNPGEMRTVLIRAWAQHRKAIVCLTSLCGLDDEISIWDDGYIPPANIFIRGQPLTPEGSIWGSTVLQVPAGTNLDVTPVVLGAYSDFYSFDMEVEDITVEEVVWEATLESALDPNPNAGGGFRIFPDKQSSSDTTARNRVQITAAIASGREGVPVYFKSFDVDDPSSASAPVDSNDSSGPAGLDNRGTPQAGTLTATSTTTDWLGYATVEFEVTMQPGDNFKVIAGNDEAVVNSVTQAQVDSGNLPPGVVMSDMLTVWRRLHVEVDSMATVTSNFVTGVITNISGTTTSATNLDLNIDLRMGLTPQDQSYNLDDGSTYYGRFENGWVKIGANAVQTSSIMGNGDTFVRKPGGFSIPSEIHQGTNVINSGQVVSLTNNTFAITGNLGTNAYNGAIFNVAGTGFTISGNTAQTIAVSAAPSLPFMLHDDDEDTLLPHLPDIWLMVEKFSPAYIVPAFDGGGNGSNNKETVAFGVTVDSMSHNAIDGELNKAGAFESEGNRADDYWIGYILTCYQSYEGNTGDLTQDHDPDSVNEWGPHGVNGGGSSFRRGTLYFHESTRDYAGQQGLSGVQATILERRFVVHEIGHQFGITHSDVSHEVGLYSSSDIYNLALDPGFEAVHLNVIRNKVTSPGE